MLLRTIVAGLALSAASSVFADTIAWDADRAIMAGNGCRKDVDAFALANGNDLSLIFSNLGVNLPGNNPTLAGTRKCLARVSARIATGLYIGELTQRLSFGIVKSAGSEVRVSARSSFAGIPVSPHDVFVPQGQAVTQPLLERTRTDQFLVSTPLGSRFCLPTRAPNIIYQADLASGAQKRSSRESAVVSIDGLDLRFEVVAALRHCDI